MRSDFSFELRKPSARPDHSDAGYSGPLLNHACSDGHLSQDVSVGYVFVIHSVHTQMVCQVVYYRRCDTIIVLVCGCWYGIMAVAVIWSTLGIFRPQRGRFCTVLRKA